MLNQQTLEKLHGLRLHGMAEAFRAQSEQAGITELSFEERFALLVDQQWNWRQNRALEHRLRQAKLRHRASVEDLDFRSPARLGPCPGALAHPGFGLGAGASEHFSARPDRNREELPGLRLGREGLPGWLYGLLHAGSPTVSRSGVGPRRRQSALLARPVGAPGGIGRRRLGHVTAGR